MSAPLVCQRFVTDCTNVERAYNKMNLIKWRVRCILAANHCMKYYIKLTRAEFKSFKSVKKNILLNFIRNAGNNNMKKIIKRCYAVYFMKKLSLEFCKFPRQSKTLYSYPLIFLFNMVLMYNFGPNLHFYKESRVLQVTRKDKLISYLQGYKGQVVIALRP